MKNKPKACTYRKSKYLFKTNFRKAGISRGKYSRVLELAGNPAPQCTFKKRNIHIPVKAQKGQT